MQCFNVRTEFRMLTNPIRNWFLDYPAIFKIYKVGNIITARSSIGILFEALTMSNLHRFSENRKLLLSIYVNLKSLAHASVGSLAKLVIAEISKGLCTHCLRALYAKKELVINTTLVNGGHALQIIEFEFTDRVFTLHDWARELRQG